MSGEQIHSSPTWMLLNLFSRRTTPLTQPSWLHFHSAGPTSLADMMEFILPLFESLAKPQRAALCEETAGVPGPPRPSGSDRGRGKLLCSASAGNAVWKRPHPVCVCPPREERRRFDILWTGFASLPSHKMLQRSGAQMAFSAARAFLGEVVESFLQRKWRRSEVKEHQLTVQPVRILLSNQDATKQMPLTCFEWLLLLVSCPTEITYHGLVYRMVTNLTDEHYCSTFAAIIT